MASRLPQLFFVFATLSCLSWGEDEVKADFGFGESVAKHFVMPPAPEHVHDIAADKGAPSMVMLMTKVSPHCNMLKKSIREGSKVKALLSKFNVAYAEENIKLWQDGSDTYVPQVLFFTSAGKKMAVVNQGSKHRYLYKDESELEKSMLEALEKAKEKPKESVSRPSSGCWGGKGCADIDDQEFCLETAGCKWGQDKDEDYDPDLDADDSGEPCVGGEQCKGIDEKDMCEFTDGCKWTSDKDSVETETSSSGSGKEASAGGDDHKTALFDPAHSLSKDIAHMVINQADLATVKKEAAKLKKPFMVLLTTPWCDACKVLVNDINHGSSVKPLLPQFVVTMAYGDDGIRNWQAPGENYVPQAYFYDHDGTDLKVLGPTKDYKHFFMNEQQLGEAMQEALRKAGSGSEL